MIEGAKKPKKTWHSYTLPKEHPNSIWMTQCMPWVLLTSAIFHRKSAKFPISRYTKIDCILVQNFYFFEKEFNKHSNNFDNVSKKPLNFIRIWPKRHFFEGWDWFKFTNLGQERDMALNFYTSMAKVLKIKVKILWWVIFTLAEVIEEVTRLAPSWIGL